MDERDDLADGFEANRPHLRAVAYRMLGSVNEADDAVQEAWLRLNRSDTTRRREPGRVAHHRGRARLARHAALAEGAARAASRHARATADREPRGRRRPRAGGTARRLGQSRPARGARDARSSRAARVRAARHVRRALRGDRTDRRPLPDRRAAAREPRPAARSRRRTGARRGPRAPAEVVDAFLAAARGGDFDALLAVLDPEVVLRVDRGALATSREFRGAAAVIEQARRSRGWRRFARPARVNGSAGFVVASPTGPLPLPASRSPTGGSSRSTCSPTPRGCGRST